MRGLRWMRNSALTTPLQFGLPWMDGPLSPPHILGLKYVWNKTIFPPHLPLFSLYQQVAESQIGSWMFALWAAPHWRTYGRICGRCVWSLGNQIKGNSPVLSLLHLILKVAGLCTDTASNMTNMMTQLSDLQWNGCLNHIIQLVVNVSTRGFFQGWVLIAGWHHDL